MYYLEFTVKELAFYTMFTFELESDFSGCILVFLQIVIQVLKLAKYSLSDGFLPILLSDEIASFLVFPISPSILKFLS